MRRTARTHLSRPKGLFICFGLAVILPIIIFNIYAFTSHQKQIEKQASSKAAMVSEIVHSMHEYAIQTLRKNYIAIQESNGSLNAIQAILQQSTYNSSGLIRFIWADRYDKVKLSSHTQHVVANTDISIFQYAQHARANPGELYLSKVLIHPEPFMHQRQLITYSMGINRNSQHAGTHYALIDLYQLKKTLLPILEDCECHYQLKSPHGETILSNSPATNASASSIQGTPYQLNVVPRKELVAAAKQHYLMQAIIASAGFSALLTAIYLLLKKRILRPLSQALTLITPSAIAGAAAQPAGEIEQLQSLAEGYNAMQQRLQEQEQMLSECGQIITELQSQQQRFLSASSGEMQQMFSAITHYAEHLEELVCQQQLHPDAPYEFDDVREMGENLRHLSECFVTFSKQEDIKTEAADPARILQQNLLELEPFMERRNLRFTLTKDREVWVMQPGSAQLMHALIRAMLFTAVRFAEDESQLDISITSLDEQVILKLDVSRFRQSSLPAEQQDFGMFLSRMQRDMTTPICDKLAKHANILIAEAISSKLNGDFRLEVPGGHRGFILCSQLAVQA